MSPSCQSSSNSGSEVESTPDDQLLPSSTSSESTDTAAAAVEAGRRRRELERTDRASEAVVQYDGRCREPPRMRPKLLLPVVAAALADTNGGTAADFDRWVETPRRLEEAYHDDEAIDSSERGIGREDRSAPPLQDSPKDLRQGSKSRCLPEQQSFLDGNGNDNVYLAHVLFLDWRDLPGLRSAAQGAERVWLLGATDRAGRHRTRLLVVGREWRPACLRDVNMISQPVVYAGGGRAALTADLFLWWLREEFAPSATSLHPEGVVLAIERGTADYLLSPSDAAARDLPGSSMVKLVVVSRQEHDVESRFVGQELRARLAVSLLFDALCSGELADEAADDDRRRERVIKHVKDFSLKEAFAELHRAWLAIRPKTFGLCWKSHGGGGVADHEEDEEQHRRRRLLDELRRFSRLAGLDATEAQVQDWLRDKESEQARFHCYAKSEPVDEEDQTAQLDCSSQEEVKKVPTAREAIGHLSRVLDWMETEPLDPGFLLAARAMRSTATLMASKMGLTGAHPSGLPFFCPNGDHLSQPPPAHMGIPPYGSLDAGKAAAAAGEYCNDYLEILGIYIFTLRQLADDDKWLDPGKPRSSSSSSSVVFCYNVHVENCLYRSAVYTNCCCCCCVGHVKPHLVYTRNRSCSIHRRNSHARSCRIGFVVVTAAACVFINVDDDLRSQLGTMPLLLLRAKLAVDRPKAGAWSAHAEHVPDLAGQRRLPKSLPHEFTYQQFKFTQGRSFLSYYPLYTTTPRSSGFGETPCEGSTWIVYFNEGRRVSRRAIKDGWTHKQQQQQRRDKAHVASGSSSSSSNMRNDGASTILYNSARASHTITYT
ncbi:unnamed protein product [Trichogramma brassicae]|uniref:Uncharacterized protein n=1 Tax=Trichogramma brassicae TaxID=86971 RepID=A0A6H5I235_9HYME|nr:unnamed protein product [Trichogramma brassicae]